jgi:hypothetical protein
MLGVPTGSPRMGGPLPRIEAGWEMFACHGTPRKYCQVRNRRSLPGSYPRKGALDCGASIHLVDKSCQVTNLGCLTTNQQRAGTHLHNRFYGECNGFHGKSVDGAGEPLGLGNAGVAEERCFNRCGQTDELGEGIVAETADPDVAGSVDGEVKGFEHTGVGSVTDGG